MKENVLKAKESVLWGCKTMCERGYVLGTAGNISARVEGENAFVITPSAYPYNIMTLDDLVVADFDGNVLEGDRKPSIEFAMHMQILKDRPDTFAVVHTHSKFATAASSVVGLGVVPAIDLESVIYIGGNIEVAPFETPGTMELARAASMYLGDRAGVLLENHGAIATGKTMEDAMVAGDNIERTCEMYLSIRAMGDPKRLPQDYIDRMTEVSRKRRGVVS